jgi:hypothetical protein
MLSPDNAREVDIIVGHDHERNSYSNCMPDLSTDDGPGVTSDIFELRKCFKQNQQGFEKPLTYIYICTRRYGEVAIGGDEGRRSTQRIVARAGDVQLEVQVAAERDLALRFVVEQDSMPSS